MTIKDLRDIYEGSSTKASDLNRKLIFAGIAIVWIFRDSTKLDFSKTPELVDQIAANAELIIPEEFRPVLLLFCISLCMDILQYIVRAVMWHIYYHIHRVPEAQEKDVEAQEPEWMNAFPDSLWYAKFVPTLLAYINLASMMSIAFIDKIAWLKHISGWRVAYVWGVILGVLLIWYVVLEWLPIENIQRTSTICQCIRFSLGVAIVTSGILLLVLA